ncbi:voltage-dependent anion-selective channel-like [Watersipora subatra]|uniref:voltage-dependent anion-selective channel-like n=1 Tax=Watersipora subatra TaxID=2589382 RepID=UPI00355BFB14
MKFLVKAANDGTITSENTIEDKIIDGLKVSLDGSVNSSSGYKKGQLKTKYKTESFNGTMDIDTNLNVKASLTAAYKSYVFGYLNAYDVNRGQLLGNNFAISHVGEDYSVNAIINEQQSVSASIYHRLSRNLETVVGIGWKEPLISPAFRMGCRYMVSKDTSVRMKVNQQGQIGLSLQQNLEGGFVLTLSALLDGKDISGGGHGAGLAVEYN